MIWILTIWIPETFEYQTYEVQISNGHSLCAMSRWRKMASICPVFKWSDCPIFKWHSNTRPFGIRPLFDHFNTKLGKYSDPHWILVIKVKQGLYKFSFQLSWIFEYHLYVNNYSFLNTLGIWKTNIWIAETSENELSLVCYSDAR